MTPSEDEVRELKSCPFCGASEPVRVWDHADDPEGVKELRGLDVQVVCDARDGGCGGSTGYRPGKHKAIADWNRRAEASGEVVVDEDVVDDLQLALVRAGICEGDRRGRAPKPLAKSLLTQLRKAGYLGDPVRWVKPRADRHPSTGGEDE